MAGLCALLVGCAAPDNTRTTLGGPLGHDPRVVALPALSPATPVALVDEGPSVSGLDRSSWEMKVVVLPVDQTQHLAHLTDLDMSWRDDATGARFPTMETALGTEGSCGSEVAGLVLWPVKAARDVVLAPWRLSETHRGLTYSPKSDAYERTGD